MDDGGRTFIYHGLQGNQNSSGLQIEVVYWPALVVGSTAQLAAAHCLNERNLQDPRSAARQTHLCPIQPHYGLLPVMFSGSDSLVHEKGING